MTGRFPNEAPLRRLGVAIVGCGWAGRMQAADGFGKLPELFELISCWSRDPQRTSSLREKHNIAEAAESLETIASDPRVDIVSICTPPASHQEMILKFLKAGKHVICEKPLTSSLRAVDEIIACERQSAGRVMPIFQKRFDPGIAKARRIIQSGLAGPVHLATVDTHLRRGADYYAVSWRGTLAADFGGVMFNQAMHNHDILVHLLGPIANVSAICTTRVNPIEVEDCAVASLQMESGAVVSLSATLGSRLPLARFRICLEDAVIERQQAGDAAPAPWTFEFTNSALRDTIEREVGDDFPTAKGFGGQFEAYHAALKDGGPLPVTLEDARRSIELASAIYRSSTTGRAVALPTGAEDDGYNGWMT